MKKNVTKDISLFFLAVIFSVALMFAFIELPRWIDALLHENMGFPGFDQGAGDDAAFKSDVFISALHLRWIGYGSLILVVFFIMMGFLTRKSGWAWAGAFVIFLPVFGQFALSMFFLSGLGILRTGWLPFIEAGFPVLDLGMIIYVPYWVLMWFFGLFNWYAYDFISWLFMSVGAFLFVWGVFVWLQSRFGSKGVATQWIYKISRHPQYLGWIIWSYGLMLFSMTENNMKKSWGIGTSFPWLIMTMVILAICMLEELAMREKYGKEYDEYRAKTPFLFPMPKWLKSFFKAPMRLVTNNKFLQNRKQVAGVTLVYTLIFMLVSLIWIDFGTEEQARFVSYEETQKVIDSLDFEIQHTTERRTLSVLFEELGKLGDQACSLLIFYLSDPNPVCREFATNQLGHLRDTTASMPLIKLLEDDNWRVRNSVANALAEIGDKRAIPPLIQLMNDPDLHDKYPLYGVLGGLGAAEAWPYIAEGTDDTRWYARKAAVNALTEIDFKRALPYVIDALNDSLGQVRRNAVFILLKYKPVEAVGPLQQVLDDEDFETRFYAKQALELIEK